MKRAMAAATASSTPSPEPATATNQRDNRYNRKTNRFFSSPGTRKSRSNAKSLPVCSLLLIMIGLACAWLYITFTHSIIYSAHHLQQGDYGIDTNATDSNVREPSNNSNSNKKVGALSHLAAKDTASNKGTDKTKTKTTAGFVHIGKTAGSTLSLLLRNGCHSFVKPKPCRIVPNETATSRFVEAYYHVPDYHRLPASDHQIYVLSMRDVYDRTVSSFLYHHPRNIPAYTTLKVTKGMEVLGPIAYQCFPTLEAFASLLHRGNKTDCNYPYKHFEIINTDCSELACAAIHGKVRHFIHLFFNYRNIYAKIPISQPPKRLFAIRKERLWEDWWRINSMLRDEEEYTPPPPPPQTSKQLSSSGEILVAGSERNTTGMKLPVSRDISDGRRQQLCKALEPEYRVFFQILRMAENIGARELEDAKQFAETNCPNLDVRSMLIG